MRGGRLGGMGVNPLIDLAGLGMFGMMMRPRGMGNMGNRNRQTQGQGKINIVAANGGENWKIGSTQTISWIANGLNGVLDNEYRKLLSVSAVIVLIGLSFKHFLSSLKCFLIINYGTVF